MIHFKVTKVCYADPESKQPIFETMKTALIECGITDDPNKVGKPIDNVNGEESGDVKEGEEEVEKEEKVEKVEEEKEENDEKEEKSK